MLSDFHHQADNSIDPLNDHPEIKNTFPDDLKLKIEDYFFLNTSSSYPFFPLTITTLFQYFVRCLFVLCSMLVR